MRKLLPRLAVSLIITVALVWWVTHEGLPILPAAASYDEVTWWAAPAFLVVLCLVHFFRAYRWRFLVSPMAEISLHRMMCVAFVGFFAILMMPLRMGEFARPWLLKKETGLGMSEGFGTIAIERVVDGVLVSLWLTLALFAVDPSTSEWVWWLRLGPLGLFLSSLVVLVAFVIWPLPVRRIMDRISRLLGHRLNAFVLHVLDGFHDGLKALPSRALILGFTLWSVVYWGLNALAFWVLAMGCGMDLGLLGSVSAMGILAVGILLPAGVGLFGSFQASLLIALSLYLPPDVVDGEGAVFIFINYLGQLVITLGPGIYGMVVTRVGLGTLVGGPVRDDQWDHAA